MVKIAIIGASGMLGQALAQALLKEHEIGGTPIETLVLADIRTCFCDDDLIHWVTGDAADPSIVSQIIAHRPDVIFHVAATAMGQADSNFAIGYHINFETVRVLVEALRLVGDDYCPRLVHASSIGVFGAPFPAVIAEHQTPRPDSSYGTQKLMSEAIIADYSRMGFIDGICLRLPTIAVRPGPPTHGNSGFFSNIIREPLKGNRVLLPASEDVRHWLASPESAVAQLIHAATLPAPIAPQARALTMPGASVTVEALLSALAIHAGEDVLSLIDRQPPPVFTAADFPARFETQTATALGFPLFETSASDLVATYLRQAIGS